MKTAVIRQTSLKQAFAIEGSGCYFPVGIQGAAGGVDPPVVLLVRVEPHDRFYPRELLWDLFEKGAPDPSRLVSAMLRAPHLRDYHWFASHARHRGVGRAEYRREALPARPLERVAPVVAAYAEPVHVGVAGVDVFVGDRALVLGDRGPDPPDVRGAFLAEDAVHPLPSRDELAGGIPVDPRAPGGPVAVHFVGETQKEGLAPGRRRPGPTAHVSVVLSVQDLL